MTSTPAQSAAVSIDELVESLTGFEEIAIEKHFDGFDIYVDGETKGVRAMRALAFVQHRRAGMDPREAFRTAQETPFRVLSEMFIEDEPEVDPDEPETPSGKDATTPA